MTMWQATDISITPDIELASWRVFKINQNNTSTMHFVGYNLTEQEGRVSSAIQEFNRVTQIGITHSGRHYKLVGQHGRDRDADYVWGNWMIINKVQSENVTDVTNEYTTKEMENA